MKSVVRIEQSSELPIDHLKVFRKGLGGLLAKLANLLLCICELVKPSSDLGSSNADTFHSLHAPCFPIDLGSGHGSKIGSISIPIGLDYR